MAGLEIENSQGVVALDQQQWRDLRNGYGVAPSTALGTLNGECEVTINGTGDLGTGNSALSVGSGTVLFGGTTTSVSAQNVDIDAGQSNPRKDVVYIDTNGDAQVNKGSPASVPSDAPGNRFQTWKPAPYDMHDVDAVVLAEVWVPANASSIGASDVRDRRLRADLETRAFATEDLDIGTADFVDSGDFLATGPSLTAWSRSTSTTSTSYVADTSFFEHVIQWDVFAPANATTAFYSHLVLSGSDGDVRLRNGSDADNVFEVLNASVNAFINRVDNYTPSTTGSAITIQFQHKTNDGGTSTTLRQAGTHIGVQV